MGAVFRRIGAIGHALADRHEQSSAETLNEPPGEKRRNPSGHTPAEASHRHNEQRGNEHAAFADPARKPAPQRNGDSQAEHVDRADPGEMHDGCAQLPLQRRQGGIEDEHIREIDGEAEKIEGGNSGAGGHRENL